MMTTFIEEAFTVGLDDDENGENGIPFVTVDISGDPEDSYPVRFREGKVTSDTCVSMTKEQAVELVRWLATRIGMNVS